MSTDQKDKTVGGFTILIAEDSDADAMLLRRAYTKTGLPHQLRFVRNGEEVMDYLEGKPPYSNRQHFPMPDLLLLDLDMPRVDGFNVLRWVQLTTMKRLPIIVLSGAGHEVDKRFATQLGAREYHTKSSDPAETAKFLKDVCERWLKK